MLEKQQIEIRGNNMQEIGLNRTAIIGKRIRRLRNLRGLNQDWLANAAEISQGTLVLIESGRADAKSTTLVKLANALKVHPANLLLMDATVNLHREELCSSVIGLLELLGGNLKIEDFLPEVEALSAALKALADKYEKSQQPLTIK